MQARNYAYTDNFKSAFIDDFKLALRGIAGGDFRYNVLIHLDASLNTLSSTYHVHGSELKKIIKSAVDEDQLPNLFTKIESIKYDLPTVNFLKGFVYYKGLGVDKNYKKAKEYYKKAANNGLAIAQDGLAYMHYKGLGEVNGTPDYLEAKKWWEKSSKQGYAPAQSNLAKFLDKNRENQQLGNLSEKSECLVKTLHSAKRSQFYPEEERTTIERSLTNFIKGKSVEVLVNTPLILTPKEFESSEDSLSDHQKENYKLYEPILKNIADQPTGAEKFTKAKNIQNEERRHFFYTTLLLMQNGFPLEIISKITCNTPRGGLPAECNAASQMLKNRLLTGTPKEQNEDRANKKFTDRITPPDEQCFSKELKKGRNK